MVNPEILGPMAGSSMLSLILAFNIEKSRIEAFLDRKSAEKNENMISTIMQCMATPICIMKGDIKLYCNSSYYKNFNEKTPNFLLLNNKEEKAYFLNKINDD